MRTTEIIDPLRERYEDVLTSRALDFLAGLHAEFEGRRRALLAERADRQRALDAGDLPAFPDATTAIRAGDWRVAPVPQDLLDRRVEITGPTDRKMTINAMNSGARSFMADFEDANAPTFANMLKGQRTLLDAARGTIAFDAPDGRTYRLESDPAVLIPRPRGWHLVEKHVLVSGDPISASLFDFGLAFLRTGPELMARGSGPYYYLPKLESAVEAALWNDVFCFAQDALAIPRGTIKATVLIETILAAFQMDEILHALRDHAAGLNAGRWDYIFSIIKKFHAHPEFLLPDRAQVTMAVPFMRAYTQLLVRTCHRRGAHAIGGMAAFIPSRRDPEINDRAFRGVREDKQREAGDGFDGTWVAHPDLVPVAGAVFDEVLGPRPNQLDVMRDDVDVPAAQLLDLRMDGGAVTDAGLRNNVIVSLRYLAAWLDGRGAVGLFNLMEDTATAEIARAQVWQWIRHHAAADGEPVTPDRVRAILDQEVTAAAEAAYGDDSPGRVVDARELFEETALGESFVEFLTIPGYERLS